MIRSTSSAWSRRAIVAALLASGGLVAAGCSAADKKARDRAREPSPTPKVAAAALAMTVNRDPSCGCCEAWAELARKAGYRVSLVDNPDMPAVKRQFGVPEELASCHTAIVGGYAIEGHVPFADVARLLERKPAGIKGIAVAGMPRGAPGMEMPDGSSDPFQVMAFDAAGRVTAFA